MTYLSKKVIAFKVKYDEHLVFSRNHYVQQKIISEYEKWKNTEIAEWCAENNIDLHQSEEIYHIDTMQYSILFYINLTIPQYKEYKEIIFYKKLTE